MKKLAASAMIVFLTGCNDWKPKETPPREKLINYKCLPSQLGDVDRQFKICNESQYTSTHCYMTSVASICQYIGSKNN